ncbi:MAG: hypothetical protein CO090_07165 [Acidobacteria bacterium CG_4_9_14_3_um_filter_49_7]|nr:MAG: hypothetical protein CO090_07165 [Acidobacteria bacterium CG_4_9_14_3_um_filter_49_7]
MGLSSKKERGQNSYLSCSFSGKLAPPFRETFYCLFVHLAVPDSALRFLDITVETKGTVDANSRFNRG